MNYICYNMRGDESERGTLSVGAEIDIPTGGCIAVEIPNVGWLNFNTSEWSSCWLTAENTNKKPNAEPSILERIQPMQEKDIASPTSETESEPCTTADYNPDQDR